MGYVMERGALVDKMFYSIQLAFRNVPASLAVATLIVCTFWGIASGLVGAVVVLMGVIAFNPMLRAGYDVKLAAGVITAGGTLGISYPALGDDHRLRGGRRPVGGQASPRQCSPASSWPSSTSIYIIGWAMLIAKIAPVLPEEQRRVPVPDWMRKFQSAYSNNVFVGLLAALAMPARALAIDTGKRPRHLSHAGEEFRLLAGAIHHRRRHLGARLVVCRDPSAGGNRGSGRGAATARHAGPCAESSRRNRNWSAAILFTVVRRHRVGLPAVAGQILCAPRRRSA